MEQLNIPIKGKNILVVYTKADLLPGIQGDRQLPYLPDSVLKYLAEDEYDQIKNKRGADLKPFDEDDYFHKMLEISETLREYTSDFVDGGAFIAMAESYGAEVYFTMNSAYGGAPNADGTIGVQARRIRVLDSLIWAIKLGAPNGSELEVALMLPSSTSTNRGISLELVTRFYEVLSSSGGNVATYYVGQMKPAFSVGRPPASLQSSKGLPLIGPILDQLKPGTRLYNSLCKWQNPTN